MQNRPKFYTKIYLHFMQNLSKYVKITRILDRIYPNFTQNLHEF